MEEREKRPDYYSKGLPKDHVGLQLLGPEEPLLLNIDLRTTKRRKHGLLSIDISLPQGEVRNSKVDPKVHSQLLRAEGLANFIRVGIAEGDYDTATLADLLLRGVSLVSGEVFHFIGCSQSQLKDR